MKKLMISLMLVGAAAALQAEDISVGYRERRVVDATGDVTAGRVRMGKGGKLYKCGAGNLAISGGDLKLSVESEIGVTEGSLSVTSSDITSETTVPAICQQAAYWVDETSVGTTNSPDGASFVSRWYDVRETNRAAPVYNYADPAWCTSDALPATMLNIPPTNTVYDGRSCIYFGGKKSGQYLAFNKSYAANVYHIFIVYALTSTYFHPVGYVGSARNGPLLTTTSSELPDFSTSVAMLHGRADVCRPQSAALFFLDGLKWEGRCEAGKKGWQLLECDYSDEIPAYANTFARSGFVETLKGRQGGDYMSEVLIFTNRLSEASRMEIERYLLAKWDMPNFKRQKTAQIHVASGASVTASGEKDTLLPPIAIAGEGTVTKSGEATMSLGTDGGENFDGTFNWDAGMLMLQGGRMPLLNPAAGEKFAFSLHKAADSATAASEPKSGIACQKTTDAASGRVEVTGDGWVRLNGLQSGVKQLVVTAGDTNIGTMVQLEGTRTAANAYPVGGMRATIPNADFELPFTVSETKFDRGALDSSDNGWHSALSTCHYMCFEKPRSANTWSQWVPITPPSSFGTNILQIVQRAFAWTEIVVPQAGDYELSFDAMGRYNYANTGNMTSSTTTSRQPYSCAQPQILIHFGANRLGAVQCALTPGSKQFQRYRFKVHFANAGKCTMALESVDSAIDGCSFFDNFDLVKISEAKTEETICEIPNGGFDTMIRPAVGDITPINPSFHGRYSILNQASNWTFSVEGNTKYADALTNSLVGVVTTGSPMMIGPSDFLPLFQINEATYGSSALAFVSTCGVARSTFTVPAGTWMLRGKVQRRNTFMKIGYPKYITEVNLMTGVPVFRAQVAFGDSALNLGDVTTSSQLYETRIWPNFFTLSEESQVTLTLSHQTHNAMGMLDDLELVKVDRADYGNLLKDSGFEGSGWKLYAGNVTGRSGSSVNSSSVKDYSYMPDHWGYLPFDGKQCLHFINLSGAKQAVTIPEAGLYRFTMHYRSRNDSSVYAGNTLRVWLKDSNDVTNFMAVTSAPYTWNWIEGSYLVNVPSAGEYTLGIEGLCRDDSIARELSGGSRADQDAQIDGVSLVKCNDTFAATPTIPEDVSIKLSKGARLLLDYTGTAKCRRLEYDGVTYWGTISAATHPEFATGLGALSVEPKGLWLIIR